jgi:hypothetical protein
MNWEIIGAGAFLAASAGVHFYLYTLSRKLFTHLETQIVTHTLTLSKSLEQHAANLGQKIEIGKVAGRIERIVCSVCRRVVFKFNDNGVCNDCASKEA